MKLYVYFLSLLIAIIPIYANALTPIHAIGATVAGEVALGVGKATIKKMPTETRKKLVKNATGMCAKSLLSFAFCDSLINSMVGDGIDIEINNNEINFYKNSKTGECKSYQEYYVDYTYNSFPSSGSANILSNFYSSIGDIKSWLISQHTTPDYMRAYGFSGIQFKNLEKSKKIIEEYKENHPVENHDVDVGKFITVAAADVIFEALGREGQVFSRGHIFHGLVVVNHLCGDKRKITDDELEEYFKKIAKGDDITNIYNYDYSDNSITVNGEKMDGNDLNKRKNDFDKNYRDKNLSKEATDKMKRKKKDYDIDDINDKNCDKNEQGEYDKCGSDREKEKELDEYCKKYPSEKICQERQKEKETDEHCEKNPQDSYCKAREDAKKKKEQEEKLCKLNPEHSSCKKDEDKKDDDKFDLCKAIPLLCDLPLSDIIDWFKKEPTDDTKIDIDTPKIDIDTNINFGGSCPANVVVPFGFAGFSVDVTVMDWSKLCWMLSTYLKPLVIALSSYQAVRILGGQKE